MISDVRDYIQRYVQFQELLINAQAELEALQAEEHKYIASIDKMKVAEMQVRVTNARTYVSRLKQIVTDWGDALAHLGQTYNKVEYEMFNTLIIKGVLPAKTKWSKRKCYKFMNQVRKDIARLETNYE